MKKKCLLFTALMMLLLAQNNLSAQDSKNTGFNDLKGFNLLNAGIGLGSYGLSGTGGLPVTAQVLFTGTTS